MKDKDCIFCKLANGDITTVSVYEDELFKVIFDANPASRGHLLILPKEHFKNLMDLSDKYRESILSLAAKLGEAQIKAFGAKGFNIVQNNGEAAGQSVMHFHMHIIPRYGEDEMILWKPGESDSNELLELKEKVEQFIGK